MAIGLYVSVRIVFRKAFKFWNRTTSLTAGLLLEQATPWYAEDATQVCADAQEAHC